MNSQILQLVASVFVLSTMSAAAAIRYVNVSSASPAPPYTNWTTAATTIQDAVDAAVSGDQILVTNGVYQTGGRVVVGALTNRVAVNKPVTVQSVNGAAVTVIRGFQVSGTTNGDSAIRCVYLTHGAALVGFTLTNGATRSLGGDEDGPGARGGGVSCESASVIVSNCMLSGNSADFGGGASGGTLNNCSFTGNSAAFGGGAGSSTLNNCTLSGNSASWAGGGADGGTLNNCILSGNSAGDEGGGAFESTLSNCILTGNSAFFGGGSSERCTLNNCTLNGNSAGHGGGAFGGTLNNCTLSANSASYGSGGAESSTLNNCIVYYNSSQIGSNIDNYSGSLLSYSCTTPLPTNGTGNLTKAPLFVDYAGGNLRLQSNSPCINAGANAFAPAGPDLDRNPRIVGGTLDLGAYEFQSPRSRITYAWLQQYGLPTDGSADFTDADGDGLNNWQEWRFGTDPTNVLSALRLLAPAPVGSGLVVRWESVADRTYFLERSTTASSGFTPLATGIPGLPGTTTYTDTNAIGAGPWFYRVGISAP
jgi:hypothetical protein